MNKKLSQNDLRRFMSDQKKKISVNGKKVDSPLAKYPLHTVFTFLFRLCLQFNSTLYFDY